MMRRALAALIIFLAMVSNVRAESALDLLASCRAAANGLLEPNGTIRLPPAAEYCWGAFVVLQELSRIVDSSNRRMLNACVGPKVTRLQLVMVFLKYADDHPAELDQDFSRVAVSAFRDAFPCQ
jgi:hypothetical protein